MPLINEICSMDRYPQNIAEAIAILDKVRAFSALPIEEKRRIWSRELFEESDRPGQLPALAALFMLEELRDAGERFHLVI